MSRKISLEEAVNFVLTPGSDSELSDLSEEEDDVDEIVENENIDASRYINVLQYH